MARTPFVDGTSPERSLWIASLIAKANALKLASALAKEKRVKRGKYKVSSLVSAEQQEEEEDLFELTCGDRSSP